MTEGKRVMFQFLAVLVALSGLITAENESGEKISTESWNGKKSKDATPYDARYLVKDTRARDFKASEEGKEDSVQSYNSITESKDYVKQDIGKKFESREKIEESGDSSPNNVENSKTPNKRGLFSRKGKEKERSTEHSPVGSPPEENDSLVARVGRKFSRKKVSKTAENESPTELFLENSPETTTEPSDTSETTTLSTIANSAETTKPTTKCVTKCTTKPTTKSTTKPTTKLTPKTTLKSTTKKFTPTTSKSTLKNFPSTPLTTKKYRPPPPPPTTTEKISSTTPTTKPSPTTTNTPSTTSTALSSSPTAIRLSGVTESIKTTKTTKVPDDPLPSTSYYKSTQTPFPPFGSLIPILDMSSITAYTNFYGTDMSSPLFSREPVYTSHYIPSRLPARKHHVTTTTDEPIYRKFSKFTKYQKRITTPFFTTPTTTELAELTEPTETENSTDLCTFPAMFDIFQGCKNRKTSKMPSAIQDCINKCKSTQNSPDMKDITFSQSFTESSTPDVADIVDTSNDSLWKIPEFTYGENKTHFKLQKTPEDIEMDDKITQIAKEMAENSVKMEEEEQKLGRYIPISLKTMGNMNSNIKKKSMKFQLSNPSIRNPPAIAPVHLLTEVKILPQYIYKDSLIPKISPAQHRFPVYNRPRVKQEAVADGSVYETLRNLPELLMENKTADQIEEIKKIIQVDEVDLSPKYETMERDPLPVVPLGIPTLLEMFSPVQRYVIQTHKNPMGDNDRESNVLLTDVEKDLQIGTSGNDDRTTYTQMNDGDKEKQ